MTPERWQTIKDVLATVLELDPAERSTYLEASCKGDEQLRREIDLLLQDEDKASTGFLNQTAFAEMAARALPAEESPWIGRRVGAYQIVQQIGVGGMGEVYRAVRADDQYRQEVALKVVRTGQDSGQVIQRFRNERQILASLEHPNIARLLDGGTTEEGLPYLVMEMIEGVPIGEYCDKHALSILDRLKLFIQVCSAVQYAHQRLIIHRDIKPSNILVTADGTPKLLDFGIAKVLASDLLGQEDQTLTVYRVLTPGYASPEQVNDEPMTTASDVYSLGVVLYELLTGSSPYKSTTRRPQELAVAVRQVEPQKPSLAVARKPTERTARPSASVEEIAASRNSSPSRLRKQLAGDLDNIVLMALRKEPSRRYASAEQFGADLRRHLDSSPVLARKDTSAYRVSKFISRHKAGVAGSIAATLAILAGLAFALHEARVAREQARIAEAQRLRAEHRFNDVRKLANSLMFEVHDSIRDLPGATSARKLLVSRAVEYLDSLSQESSGDVSLQRELAAAYDRVGDLLGYMGAANLGDLSGALQNYQKALAIREASAQASPGDAAIQFALLNEYFHLSFVLLDVGDSQGALKVLAKGLPIADGLAKTQSDPKYRDMLAGFYWRTGSIQNGTGDYPQAAESFRRAASIREPIALAPNSNPWFRTHLAADYDGLARALQNTGDLNAGLDAARKALQLLEQASRSDRNNATLREFLGEAYMQSASLLAHKKNADQALEQYRSANRIFAELQRADPSNSLARNNFASSQVRIAQQLLLKHQVQLAIPQVKQAIAIFESIEDRNAYDTVAQAEAYRTLGTAYQALADNQTSETEKRADLREARNWLQKSVTLWREFVATGRADPLDQHYSRLASDELAECESDLARLQHAAGNPSQAASR